MESQNLEEKFIFLEISGENGDLEIYKKSLCEASLLNINRIIFGCIWDNNIDRGDEIFKKLVKICEVLQIVPFSMTVGYEGSMYNEAMVGKLKVSKDSVLPDFVGMVSMSEYKISNGITLDEEQLKNNFAKIMQLDNK